MPPKVSVIVANYNYGAYLEQSLRSVLGQIMQDFEVILTDDGSTDDSRDVIERLKPEFGGRLKVIYQKNSGVAAARNVALLQTSGEFIGFLDADDVWLESCLEDLLYFLEYYPDEMGVYGNADLFDSVTGRALGAWFGPRSFRKPYSGLCNDKLFLQGNFIPITATLIRRKALGEIGNFDERLRVGEDLDLWLRFTSRYAITYYEKVVCRIRRHSQNLSFIPLNTFTNSWILRKTLRCHPELKSRISPDEMARRWHQVYYEIGRRFILEGKPRRGNRYLRRAWHRRADCLSSKIIVYFVLSYLSWRGSVFGLRKFWLLIRQRGDWK